MMIEEVKLNCSINLISATADNAPDCAWAAAGHLDSPDRHCEPHHLAFKP